MTAELLLVDLSSIAYPIYLMSQSNADPNHASQQIVARIRALASGHPHAAICCDSGRSFRADIAPSYKANRPESDAPLHHQIALAKEQLAADGFPVWAVRAFEADDVIASATERALELEETTVLIVSADKDLLQLVGPRVLAMSARDGSLLDADAVTTKFGVRPDQMRDYLTLVGDASDNVKGATGIGPKKAADLLARYASLDGVYAHLAIHGSDFTPSLATSLQEFRQRLDDARTLITLRANVEIPFDEILAERVARAVDMFTEFGDDDMCDDLEQPTAERAGSQDEAPRVDAAQSEVTDLPGNGAPQSDASSASRLNTASPQTAIAVRDAEILQLAPAQWERQLDPRSMKDARLLAKDMYDSRMFSAYGSPQAVLSTVMVGRELGLPAMASLRSVHNIDGRHALSASLMVALVLKSNFAEFFEPISFSETEATYETQRKGARNPVRLTHTIEMAVKAWPKTKKDWQQSFDASGWGRTPTDMLCARASSRLARMVYPDLLAGLYTPEELLEIRESVAA